MALLHAILQRKYTDWEELEAEIEKLSDPGQKGDVFEQFVYFFLAYHKDYYQILEIYSPKIPGREIPRSIRSRLKLETKDFGVDGAYVTNQSELAAYQVKFRSGAIPPDARELAMFWAEGEYADIRCVIANSYRLPLVSEKKKNQIIILRDRFEKLDASFFDALAEFARSGETKEIVKAKPRPYQEKMLEGIITGFKKTDKGKLIAACGTGKTMISLWVSEQLNASTVLFLAPSLILVRQTLEAWAKNANEPFTYLCVCSDESISSGLEEEEDYLELKPEDIDFPVTTDQRLVKRFLLNTAVQRKKVIFATYHSANVIKDVLSDPSFKLKLDFTVFDEAHRTAGAKDSSFFTIALDETAIPTKKKLFMTATERLVMPWIRDRVQQAGQVVFSMDDEKIYGPVFYKLSFGTAINEGIISDYRVVLAGITQQHFHDLVKKNRYLSIQVSRKEDMDAISAQDLFKAILVLKVMEDLKAKKLISYHSAVRRSKVFVSRLKILFDEARKNQKAMSENVVFENINGGQAAAERADIFNAFEKADRGVLSNVRCLTEGVDFPYINGILFASPKNSLIDIVQAVGRALRQPYGERSKLAYIILPVILPEKGGEIRFDDDQFDPLHKLIEALREQDETLAEWIDELNLHLVTGKAKKEKFGRGKLKIILPQGIDIHEFEHSIEVKIAEVCRNPSSIKGEAGRLGKTERKSEFSKQFGSIGDYNVDAYRDSLVDPTLRNFISSTDKLKREALQINNNNVSHTERLGLIFQEEKNTFVLSKLGRMYNENKMPFPDVFKNQMLLYCVDKDGKRLLPYRAAFEVLQKIEALNYIEFLYGVYSLVPSGSGTNIEEVVERILWIRNHYPNAHLTGAANRDTVREALNSRHPTGFSHKDVWTDRTTAGNQYRFFSNHMSLFDDICSFDWSDKALRVIEGGSERIREILEASVAPDEHYKEYYGFWIWYPESKRS